MQMVTMDITRCHKLGKISKPGMGHGQVLELNYGAFEALRLHVSKE